MLPATSIAASPAFAKRLTQAMEGNINKKKSLLDTKEKEIRIQITTYIFLVKGFYAGEFMKYRLDIYKESIHGKNSQKAIKNDTKAIFT